MSDVNDRCDHCGRFMSFEQGSGGSWANVYDFVAMELVTTETRCPRCTSNHGPAESNARPCNGDMSGYQGVY